MDVLLSLQKPKINLIHQHVFIINPEIDLDLKNVTFVGTISRADDLLIHLHYVPISDEEVKQLKLGNEGQKLQFFEYEELRNINLRPSLKVLFNECGDKIKNMMENGIVDSIVVKLADA